MATIQEDQRTKKVSQGAIDDIRKMGMGAAIKKYTAGEGGAEFKTAVERYYSPQRLKAASAAATKGQVAPSPAAKSTPISPATTPISSTRPSPEAVARRLNQQQSPGSGRFGGPNYTPPASPPKPKKPKAPPPQPAKFGSASGGGMGRSSH